MVAEPQLPLSLEDVLHIAVERMQSKAGLDRVAFRNEFAAYRTQLLELLPQLTAMPPDRLQRALAAGELALACQLGWIDEQEQQSVTKAALEMVRDFGWIDGR